MADNEKPSRAADQVRRLAAEGGLVRYFHKASNDERRLLWAGATEIAGPLVFLRVTRPIEHKRGHHQCATGVRRLSSDCVDRYHDDVESTVRYLFAFATAPIDNLEGWLTVRVGKATVDGHRRRRGQRGAQQRPRVAAWLVDALDGDVWLVALAKAILEWVGTDTALGVLWPLGAWTEQRAVVTGDHTVGESVVAAEIETVLTAMRQRPAWYDKYVDQPMGRKQAPVWFPSRDVDGGYAEPEPFTPVAPYEQDDALLQELAAVALDVITQRVDRGDDPRAVVAEVVTTVFGTLPTVAGLDRLPGEEPAGAELVAALIEDPQRREQIVTRVVAWLDEHRRR
ncbi:hypothetical protein O7632_01910 [Solwaraspora sp. WMMD406]|uniref:hypothetical protein n=1 Tax=Solwaraspora sp. WMMD406 TaxID=3016095 RepID=UPI0024170B05|nr:hypothetical protein [Solwaraspora sp. WMMD406]MDG4762876.1 hypothetical protein [Solwaraspora sp. WMMD406]